MTFFTQPNRDGRISTPSQIATGPQAGFLKGFQLARQMEIRSRNQFSAEYSMQAREEENFAAMQTLGMQRPKTIVEILADLENEREKNLAERVGSDVMRFSLGQSPVFQAGQAIGRAGQMSDVVEYFAGERDDPMLDEAISRYDAQFSVLKDQPVGPTPEEFSARSLYDGAIDRGREAQRAFDRSHTTTAGDFGVFAGGMVGFGDPDTSPLVAVTLPIGGVGSNIARRIASEAAVQAGLETGIMAAGQFRARQRFDPNFGFGQAGIEIAAAGVFGGAFRGVIEGGVAAGRRVFRNTEADPAPTPERVAAANTPAPLVARADDIRVVDILENFDRFMEVLQPERVYGDTRLGASRMRADLDAAARQLESFDGVLPRDLKPFRGIIAPRTDTAIPGDVSGVNFGRVSGDTANRIETIDARARQMDPEVVERFDRLTKQRDRLLILAEAKMSIEQRIFELPVSATEPTTPAARRVVTDDAAIARAAREAEMARLQVVRLIVDDLRTLKTINTARARLAPLVMRAYAAARDEYVDLPAPVEALAQLDALLARGAPPVGNGPVHVEVPAKIIPDGTGQPVTGTPDAPAGGRGARPSTADEINRADLELRDQVDAQFADIRNQLADEGAEGFELSGQRIELSDEIVLPTDDGGTRVVTVRQMLVDAADDDNLLSAVTTCRVS